MNAMTAAEPGADATEAGPHRMTTGPVETLAADLDHLAQLVRMVLNEHTNQEGPVRGVWVRLPV